MSKSKCSFCGEYQEIVYQDETIQGKPKIYINTCWKCFTLFEIRVEYTPEEIKQTPELVLFGHAGEAIVDLFPKMLACPGCQEKFIPNKPTQTKCYSCYKKNKVQEIKTEAWKF